MTQSEAFFVVGSVGLSGLTQSLHEEKYKLECRYNANEFESWTDYKLKVDLPPQNHRLHRKVLHLVGFGFYDRPEVAKGMMA